MIQDNNCDKNKNDNDKYLGAVSIVFLTMFLEGAGNILIASTKTSLMSRLGIGLSGIGLLLTVNSIFCGLFPMLLGGLSDKLGRKIVIAAGCILFLIFYFGVPFTNSFAVMIILTAVHGTAYCCTDPSAQAVLFDAYEDATPKMPLVQLAFASGALTAPIFIGIIYDKNLPWELAYASYGVLLLGLFVFTITRKFPPQAGQKAEDSVGNVFKREPKPLREGILICAFVVCYALGSGLLSRWADVFMVEVHGFSNSSAVKTLGVYQIGCIVGALFNLYLSKKVAVSKLLLSYPLIGVITLGIGIFSGRAEIFIISLFLAGVVLGTLFSLSVGLMGRLFWKNAGAATGFISSSSAAGLALSSLIAGQLVDSVGIYNIYLLMLLLIFISACLGFFINRLYKKLV